MTNLRCNTFLQAGIADERYSERSARALSFKRVRYARLDGSDIGNRTTRLRFSSGAYSLFEQFAAVFLIGSALSPPIRVNF